MLSLRSRLHQKKIFQFPLLPTKKKSIIFNRLKHGQLVPGSATLQVIPQMEWDLSSTVYSSTKTWELFRAYVVFRACVIPSIVANSNKLLDTSYYFFGKSITNKVLRTTFYGHFCGGEDGLEAGERAKRLEEVGLGAIVNYAAESTIEDSVMARDEEGFNVNMENMLQSIRIASTAKKQGFTAIKATALGSPELLRRMSSILQEMNTFFSLFENEGETNSENKSGIDMEDFKRRLDSATIKLDSEQITKLFSTLSKNSQEIHSSDMREFIQLNDFVVPNMKSVLKTQPLSEQEIELLGRVLQRLERICTLASEYNVNILMDAEQTYLQPAIDFLAIRLQQQFNTSKVVLFNTFQGYLKDSYPRLRRDFFAAKQRNFHFGCKVVRGAYIFEERMLAATEGYEDPIHDTLQKTNENYDKIIAFCLKNHKNCNVMVASHNEESIRKATQLLETLGIDRSNGSVYFGQLLGMCDHVSFSLGQNGYQAYKCLPYGPVEEVIPYLVRRAQENSNIMAGVGKQIRLLRKELRNRFFSFSF